MKIELKKVNISKAQSRETTAFTAEVWANGEKVAFADNSGHGGMTNVYPFDGRLTLFNQVKEYCESLPPLKSTDFDMDLLMSLDFFVDIQIDNIIDQRAMEKHLKRLTKDMLKGICYGSIEQYSIISFKNITIEQMKATRPTTLINKVKDLQAAGETILNTNLPEAELSVENFISEGTKRGFNFVKKKGFIVAIKENIIITYYPDTEIANFNGISRTPITIESKEVGVSIAFYNRMNFSFDDAVPQSERAVTIDNGDSVPLSQFIVENTGNGVEPISPDEINRLITLKMGQTLNMGHCGSTIIKRVK